MAISPCLPAVRECEPPRLGVQVMGHQDILLDAARPELFRADMIVMRGGVVRVITGPVDTSWIMALKSWVLWPQPLVDQVFLACVRVSPGAWQITNEDIFIPSPEES